MPFVPNIFYFKKNKYARITFIKVINCILYNSSNGNVRSNNIEDIYVITLINTFSDLKSKE